MFTSKLNFVLWQNFSSLLDLPTQTVLYTFEISVLKNINANKDCVTNKTNLQCLVYIKCLLLFRIFLNLFPPLYCRNITDRTFPFYSFFFVCFFSFDFFLLTKNVHLFISCINQVIVIMKCYICMLKSLQWRTYNMV